MKHSTFVEKRHNATMIAEDLRDISTKDIGIYDQLLTIYLSKLSIKDLKQMRKDIETAFEYINR